MWEENNNSGFGTYAKQEKLIDHANWSIWLMISKSIFIKKHVWDLVTIGH